jgi:hypothetical protein
VILLQPLTFIFLDRIFKKVKCQVLFVLAPSVVAIKERYLKGWRKAAKSGWASKNAVRRRILFYQNQGNVRVKPHSKNSAPPPPTFGGACRSN